MKTFITFFCFIGSVALSAAAQNGNYPEFNASWDRLPAADVFADFYSYAQQLKPGLEGGTVPQSALEINKGGGTSVYFKVKHGGKAGAWLPPNSATNYRGEVFAFNLARLLKTDPHLVGTAIEMHLSGAPMSWFAHQLEIHTFPGQAKRDNQAKLRRMLSQSLQLPGVYKMWGTPPAAPDGLTASGGGNGSLNTSHPIAAKLNCGTRPPQHAPVELRMPAHERAKLGGASPGYEDELVKQLSTLMLIDAFNLQWDRYSGGNLQVARHPETGRVTFVSYDNGGTDEIYKSGRLAHTYVQKTKTWVTRFDREVAVRIKEVHDFLFHGGRLDRFADEEELKRAMGVRGTSQWQSKWQSFKLVLKELNAHIRAQGEGCLIP